MATAADGTCSAILELADDHGDNVCTIDCQLPKGHDSLHRKSFVRSWGGYVDIKWERDEREVPH